MRQTPPWTPGSSRAANMPRSLAALLAIHAAVVLASAGTSDTRFAGVAVAEQPFVDQGEISGAVMLLANNDTVLDLRAVGVSDLATGRAMQTDDVFWIASMSKPITAVAVGMLVDDGRLSFDDPVEKFVPEFRSPMVVVEQSPERRVLVPAERPFTIRDLLAHTSGLGEYAVTDPRWSLGTTARVLSREPLRFQPGARWAYSTAGIDLAGYIVEVASGRPFAEFLQVRLFEPLGMAHTTFWPAKDQEDRRARVYLMNARSDRLEETSIHYMYGGAITDAQRPALGGAGLFSTAEDVMKFYRMMLADGTVAGTRILKPETVVELTHKQTGGLKARPGMPWGLGFCVIEDPAQMEANRHFSAGTFGHGGAAGTQSWADPKTGLIYVFMIQRDRIPNNPDDSPMRRAWQDALAASLSN